MFRSLACCICLLLVAVLAWTHAAEPPPVDEAPATTPPTEKITIGEETFKLEIAPDAASRARGLMGRTKIAADGGMIFIYPNVMHRSYWMKNCLTDMDLLFLNGKGIIVAKHEMKPDPPRRDDEPEWSYEQRLRRYPSGRPAQFALEFKAGTIRRLKLHVGDRIEMDLKHLKSLTRKKPDSDGSKSSDSEKEKDKEDDQ